MIKHFPDPSKFQHQDHLIIDLRNWDREWALPQQYNRAQ